MPCTPAPTSFTTPASSLPGENGSGGLNWYLFWMMSTSGKLRLAAFTEITASPGPARGEGTSSTTSESGGPNCLQSTAFIVGLHYAYPRHRRRRQAALRGNRQRRAGRVRARIRRRLPQLGAAGPPLLAPLPLHCLQRARLSAFRCARGRRALLAGARARRHPLRARRARPAARARGRAFHGRLRHAALRHDLRPPRAVDHRRRRRLRLASGAIPPVPGRLEEECRAHQARGHGGFRRRLRQRAAARPAPDQGPARLRRVPAAVQGAFAARRDEHAARRAVPPPIVLRPDCRNGAHGRAHADHVGRRGRALHRGQPADEALHPHRRPRAPAVQRPRHQPRGAGALQPPAGGFLPPGGERPLGEARQALNRAFDLWTRGETLKGQLGVEKKGSVGWIVFDQPARRNAINDAMWRGIAPAMQRFDEDPEVRCVVFRGAGTEAFSAGADISEFESTRSNEQAVGQYDDLLDRVLHAIQGSPKPSVAMIYGYCFGGGVEIALACDLRYCAASAQFSIPAAKLGLAYNVEGHKRLLETVGHARAREIMFLGRRYKAEQALAMGLVHQVLPDAQLESFVAEVQQTLSENAPLSIANTKTILEEYAKSVGAPDHARMRAAMERCARSEDYAEGGRAFMEKRKPKFQGR